MTRQACPNCGTTHDIKVYVSGQRLLCKCGIHFEVRRTDVSIIGVPRASGPRPILSDDGSAALKARVPGEPESTQPHVADPLPPPPAASSPDNTSDKTFISGSSTKLHVPGYELIEVLGRGGMGEVWRAQQKSLGRTVAVKLLPPKLAADAEFVTRFDKEATALASLSHPNIIQIIDRGSSAQHYYFVMEYVAGRSLRDLMNAGAMNTVEALKIVAQICRAIDHAHEQRIIHRDLKPENILIDDRGHVKVADFGLAGIRGTDGSDLRLQLTATSVAMGTVNYMAPEQRRDAKHVDGRADLYSLGVLMYEMLTGELPIGRFKLPSERIAGLDARIDHVVEKCLENDLEARYQNAKDVLHDLEELIGSSSSSGKQTLPPQTPQPPGGVITQRDRPAAQSVIQHGWRGVRVALMVIGGLSVIAFLAQRGVFGKVGGATLEALERTGHSGPGKLPPDTNKEIFLGAAERNLGQGLKEVSLGFGPGTEEVNAHAGYWRIGEKALKVTQAGNVSEGRLVPRAYLANRYFSSDDFTVETEVMFKSLDADFPREQDAQQFAELAFRIKDLQVSVFAIPGDTMRLGWRFYTQDNVEQVGNSARDVENMVEDEMLTPPEGKPFRMQLTLKRTKNGVQVEAFVNRKRFARKYLIGLEGRTGKVALGCRNLHCEFRDLVATGKPQPKPVRAVAQPVE
ncbi:MAG: serine/threonine protein kinase [Myxococcaceae bacterium]